MSKNVLAVWVAGLVVVADQLTKWAIRATVPLHASIPVFDSFFHITHARNSGGAFSLLAGASDVVRVPFFLVATVGAVGALLYLLRQLGERDRLLTFALAGLLGGALGNLIDRLGTGQVTDFLDLHWRGWHWPAFNVADSFITIGVAILVAHSLFASPADRSR